MAIERVRTGAPWESVVGYCRATRVGNQIFVSGTAPVDEDGSTFAPGDAYAQARKCLDIALGAIARLGADASHVVRTRMFVTDISRWEEYGRAHGEIFRNHPPATSMVEVRRLIDSDMLIEIELDAVLS